MRVGIHLANFTWPSGAGQIGPTIAAIGRAAEEVGCEHVSVMDPN
jgi:hypothetical protein